MHLNSPQETGQPHIPVMVSEVLEYLDIRPDGIYLDGTVGAGGHASHILAEIGTNGKLIGIDRDEEALDICRKRFSDASSTLSLHHGSYDTFQPILDHLGVDQLNGLLLDLGLSSLQLDSPRRGFSFRHSSALDLRFDASAGETAADLIEHSSADKLTEIFRDFGEERRARQIAKKIKKMGSITTTDDLREAIRRSTPPSNRDRTLARIFQALRIAVNGELEKLSSFLEQFMSAMAIGGRIVIMSYHSLEDRMVKHAFKSLKQQDKLMILTKKPAIASEQEQQENSRSRSAKLRAAERIA